MSLFTEIVNTVSVIIWEEKTVCGWPISSRRKGNAGTFTTPDFKPQHRVIVTKTTWQGHQIRHGDQWNLRGFSSKVTQLQPPNFNKNAKITPWRKNSLFKNGAKKPKAHMQKNKTRSLTQPKINYKIKDLKTQRFKCLRKIPQGVGKARTLWIGLQLSRK